MPDHHDFGLGQRSAEFLHCVQSMLERHASDHWLVHEQSPQRLLHQGALHVSEKHGGKVTAVTMGPPQAVEALKEAVSLGVDEVALLSKDLGGTPVLASFVLMVPAIIIAEKRNQVKPVFVLAIALLLPLLAALACAKAPDAGVGGGNALASAATSAAPKLKRYDARTRGSLTASQTSWIFAGTSGPQKPIQVAS